MPFITFEGIEGSGKSTQARRLAEGLGPAVVRTFEPGGTALGRKLRELVLEARDLAIASDAELLLFCTDRAQHVAEVIVPGLRAGQTVICDRYVDSSLAYQGYGRGVSLDRIRTLNDLATGGLRPDLTVFLDVPVAVGLARAGRRGLRDRIESEVEDFHARVAMGFRALAAAEPGRWVSIDGTRDEDAIAEEIRAAALARGWGSHAVR
jgi:dTMP kinase